MDETKPATQEPWLRGTHSEVSAVPRAVLHALELAKEDLWKWCFALNDAQLNDRPGNIPPIAFHLKHIARGMDRLLTYAEGRVLEEEQLSLMKSELAPGAKQDELFAELEKAFEDSERRVRNLASSDFDEKRSVGRKQLPTTIGGLLVHVADHTQRHVGQAITTAKLVKR